MKTILKTVLALMVLSALYLSLWPLPVDPKVWDAPTAPEFTGDFAVNSRLADFEALPLDGLSGPEAVTEDKAGNIYAATHEGWILGWTPGATEPERWVDAGGRPLGIALDAEQNMWVANAYIGLQKITPEGEISLEATVTEDVPIRYADDLVVTPDGKVYFSDATTKFPATKEMGTLAASLLDIMEHGDHGRIIGFDPATKKSWVVFDGVTFANGVTADAEGNFLLVAETGSYCIWKHWLKGAKAGQTELLVENLPGFPDNVHRGQNGRYWIGLTTIRAPILDDLSAKPFWRKVVQRLPAFMRPKVEPYGHVLAIDADGNVLTSLQDPAGAYPATTGAWESDDYLYVSSLTAPVLARYAKADLKLD